MALLVQGHYGGLFPRFALTPQVQAGTYRLTPSRINPEVQSHHRSPENPVTAILERARKGYTHNTVSAHIRQLGLPPDFVDRL